MSRRRSWAIGLLLPLLFGCARRDESTKSWSRGESEYVLTIVIDLSGSFETLMAEDGKAYDFTLAVIDRYFRERLGMPDKLIIAQISASERALLWEGAPMELRREFATADDFRAFLQKNADPRGSLVYDAIANSLEYVLMEPSVRDGRAKAAFLVLSDMLDSFGDRAEQTSMKRMANAMREFGNRGGLIGLYFVDQRLVQFWRQYLHDVGIREFQVESEIVGNPTLPNFE